LTQHLEHGRNIAELAAENGMSRRCTYRWLPRYLVVVEQRLRKH
jgi:hypothetical protein